MLYSIKISRSKFYSIIWIYSRFKYLRLYDSNEICRKWKFKKNLQNIVKDKWIVKLLKLQEIIIGLEKIHQQKLVHCDFHHGNILNQEKKLSISDLGLCKPVKYFELSFKKNDIYGVL